jgi:hypothetical protein
MYTGIAHNEEHDDTQWDFGIITLFSDKPTGGFWIILG